MKEKIVPTDQLETRINGCDKASRVYGYMFSALKELMQDEEKFKEMTPLDYSALGMYMGKFVEQEINSSVVQIMRAFCGIEMPEYYCKFYPQFDVNADVEYKNKRIRLNEHKDPQAPEGILRAISLGDAYYALRQLKEEDSDGFFNDYPWLDDKRFLEAWRKLFGYRNKMAHIGEIIDADTLKDNYKQFLVFLGFMPDMLAAKKKLAPEEYVEMLPKAPKKEEDLPYFTPSNYIPEKPYPSREVVARYMEIKELLESPLSREEELEDKLMALKNFVDTSEIEKELREIRERQRKDDENPSSQPKFDRQQLIHEKYNLQEQYCFQTIVFESVNKKYGLKDVAGKILVPAKYDGFCILYNSMDFHRKSVPAVREGRYVIVSLDGTGTELTKETYDDIRLASYGNPGSPYLYRKNGLSAWGFMNNMGEELCDCIVDGFCDEIDCAYYSSGELWGYWDYYSKLLTPPIYDNIESDGETDGFLIFTLNGEQGYVKYDGTFVPFSEFKKLNEDEQWDVSCECIIDKHLSTD